MQWHHLLSLVPGESIQRLTTQILADGLFHVLMYLIALAGGVWLWRRRQALADAGGSRRLLTGVFIGFGAWNVVDVVLFHWILEIHHIRLDVPQPLAWDVGWLVALGLTPVGLGAWAQKGRGGGPSGRTSAVAIVLALFGFGGGALRTPAGAQETLAVFRPDADPVQVMDAVAAVDGRLARVIGEGSIVVLQLPEDAQPWRLYRHGALLVSSTTPAGCVNWSTAQRPA